MDWKNETVYILSKQHEDGSTSLRLEWQPSVYPEQPVRICAVGGAVKADEEEYLLTSFDLLDLTPPELAKCNPKFLAYRAEETTTVIKAMWDKDPSSVEGSQEIDYEIFSLSGNRDTNGNDSHGAKTKGSGMSEPASQSDGSPARSATDTQEVTSSGWQRIGTATPHRWNEELNYLLLKMHYISNSALLSYGDVIALDGRAYEKHVSRLHQLPRSTIAVKTVTSNGGTTYGVLSSGTMQLKPPCSVKYLPVYTAKLEKPVTVGDGGSWIRNHQGDKLLGYMVAHKASEVVFITPAERVFCQLSKDLGVGRKIPISYKDKGTKRSYSMMKSEDGPET